MLILSVLCVIFAIVSVALAVKTASMHKSIKNLGEQLSAWLESDTNTLLTVSCGDKYVKNLAVTINEQLRMLRQERHKYLRGDAELKEAVINVSHDLRTPLTAICGYLELLQSEPANENVRRYLSMIENRTAALRQLTEELFRYSVVLSAKSEKTVEWLSLNGVLEESVAAYYGAITARNIEPEIYLPDTDVMRFSDRRALGRIFGNVLSNAIKYSDGDLKIVMDESGSTVFSNTAKELDAVSVGRLFDRFFTVENGRDSTGLGLSIAKILTEQLGGEISAGLNGDILSIAISFPKNDGK